RLVALGISERIAQNQPPLGIGIQDFDSMPRHALDSTAGLGGTPVRHVLAGRHQTDDVDLGLELADCVKGAEDARRAAHVEFHLVHVEAGLERNSAAIERNSLADEDKGLLLLSGAPVLEDDEFRRLIAAVGHRKERAHLELLELFPVKNLAFEPELVRQRLRALGEMGGSTDIARQVAQVPRQIHPVGNGKAAGSRKSRSLPRPTRSTRSASVPLTLCSRSVLPSFPSMSPRRMISPI